MPQTYSTGDLAKLAGVSVRTVQYYDKRGILLPSQLTEGGRRIYTESDLERLRMICFLREIDFPIEQIKRLFAEKNAKQVLELLLVEHIKETKEQLAEKKAKLDIAVNLLDRVKSRVRTITRIFNRHFSYHEKSISLASFAKTDVD